MKQTILIALFAVAILGMFVVPVFAQEKGEKPPKQEGKEMTKEPMKVEGLKMAACDPACGFRVVSHDESEIVSMLKEHARKHHDKNLTDKEAQAMIKDAPPRGMKGGPPPDGKPPKE